MTTNRPGRLLAVGRRRADVRLPRGADRRRVSRSKRAAHRRSRAISTGILGVAYNVAKDLVRAIFKKPDPEEIVRARKRWKDEIESNLRWIDDTVGFGELIIRDVRRADSYPKLDDRKGISPWFRVGMLGTYHRGLQVGLRIEALKSVEGRGWRYAYDEGDQPDINAHLVGRIPFERIVSIDWRGDEFYGVPHVYCHFKNNGPYEEVVFCERRRLDHTQYFSEIAKYSDVNDLTRELGKKLSGFIKP